MEKALTKVYSGPLLALAAAALFGTSTPLAKLLLGEGTSPWLLAGLLYGGSGLGLTITFVMRLRDRRDAALKRADVPWLAMIVLTGGVVAPVLLMFGLLSTSAASASLLLNLEGLATMAIAWLWFKESVDRRLLLGALAILTGAVLLSYQGAAHFHIGTFVIVGACVAWGIDNNLTRRLSTGDPVQIAAVKGVVAAIVNLSLALLRGAEWPSAAHIAAAATVGFFGYGLSLVLFVLALRQLGTARTSAYFSMAPFIGALLAVLFFGDPINANLLVAATLMGFGVYMHLTERHDHEHIHEALEHEHRHTHDEHHQHEHSASDMPGEPHSHWHRHSPMIHRHAHYPDTHHRHRH